MKSNKRILSVFMVLIMVFTNILSVYAYTDKDVDSKIKATSSYILKTVKEPSPGSIGGEWAVLGLSRAGISVPKNYYESYYKKLESSLKQNKGVLHNKKYTEYSRTIIALSAIGKDPSNVAGYNLLEKLGDFDKTVWQGINGPIFALIALDSKNYKIPANKNAKTQASRDLYIKEILSQQLKDGGFALTGEKADADITAMALQALSKYQNKKDVKHATEKALNCLSKMQKSNGGFESWGTQNVESSAQVLTALCELGISPKDKRFVKNGNTVIDNIMTFYTKDGFIHAKNGSGNSQMSTEQAFYALVSYQRVTDGKSSLYRIGSGK
ncbi:MAG: prenyltransferase/squalene oxidase repeat-containing protein [Proteocatella sp.]